jgi:hypothetical protein
MLYTWLYFDLTYTNLVNTKQATHQKNTGGSHITFELLSR